MEPLDIDDIVICRDVPNGDVKPLNLPVPAPLGPSSSLVGRTNGLLGGYALSNGTTTATPGITECAQARERRHRKDVRLAGMYINDLYADCTVRVGPAEASEPFRCNRTLLARCSDVFGKLLFEHHLIEDRNAEVCIPDCAGIAFRELVRCSHDLEPHIDVGNFIEVLKLAQRYEVDDLRDAVSEWMAGALADPALALRALDIGVAKGVKVDANGIGSSGNLGNGSEVDLSRMLEEFSGGSGSPASGSDPEVDLSRMMVACLHTAASRCTDLLDAAAFFGSSAGTIALLLQHSRLNCDEELLWCSLVHWADNQDGREHLRAVVPFVRFNVMSSEFFVDEVVQSGVLHPQEVVDLLSARATGRPAPGFPDASLPRCGQLSPRWEPCDDDVSDEERSVLSTSEEVCSAPRQLRRNGYGPGSSGSVTPSGTASLLGRVEINVSGAEHMLRAQPGGSSPGPNGIISAAEAQRLSRRSGKLREARNARRIVQPPTGVVTSTSQSARSSLRPTNSRLNGGA